MENLGKIEEGKVSVKILTTNEISMTILTEERFKGKVIQPEANANRLLGEHGLGMAITINDDDGKHLILYDTGGINQTMIGNAKQLGINLNEVEKLVLSHGHFDHFGSLMAVMPLLKEGTEIYINDDCYLQNYIALKKNGEEIPPEILGTSLRKMEKEGELLLNKKLPLLNKRLIENLANEHGLKLIGEKQPIKLHDGVAISGEIELFDENEITKGFYIQKSKKEFYKHTFRDERAIIIKLSNEGLVILTGCGHCGIVNTIKHAQKLTGVKKVHAIIGGFHEEWNLVNVVEEKVKFIEEIDPFITCGMHCTGFTFNKLMSNHHSHVLGIAGTEFNF
ncbi:MAG: MBL fold metallo-hydrolase [Promethearchaeota archaeon]